MSNVTTLNSGPLAKLDEMLVADVQAMTIDEQAEFVSDWTSRIAVIADPNMRALGGQKLRKLTKLALSHIRNQIEQIRASGVTREGKEICRGTPVRERFDDAPCPSTLEIPDSVEMSFERGTFVISQKMVNGHPEPSSIEVSFVPILLIARVQRIDGGDNEECEIAWNRDGDWQTAAIPRDVLFDSRRILRALAPLGIPFTDRHSKHLVELFERFERHNRNSLIPMPAVGKSGWHTTKDGVRFFCLGTKHIGLPEGMDVRLACGPQEREQLGLLRTRGTSAEWSSNFAEFHEQILDAHRRRQTAAGPNHGNLFAFMTYAAMSAPVLGPTGSANFVLHVGDDSTRGKTTSARFAASVYGVATGRESLVPPWDGTTSYAQAQTELYNDLPVFLDDSQTESKEKTQTAIYRLASGMGRGRLNQDATMRRRASWRCVIISLGEENIADDAKYKGEIARLISIWGGPIPDGNKKLAEDVTAAARQCYGTVGREFIEYLHSLPPEECCDFHVRECTEQLLDAIRPALDGVESPAVLERAANYFGLILFTARLAHQRFGWEWDPFEVVRDIMLISLEGYVTTADTARRSYDAIVSWMATNRTNFLDGASTHERNNNVGVRTPHSGWLGRWNARAGYTAVDQKVLEKTLERFGYNPKAMLRLWADRGWLAKDDKNLAAKVSFQGARPRMYLVRREEVSVVGQEGGST